MWSVYFLCLTIFCVLAFENANAQETRDQYYQRRFRNNRRPVIIFSSSGRRTYIPPSVGANEEIRFRKRSGQAAQKVRLDIYYETDCPDSMRFITRQLYPLYQEMDDALDIHLIPYGKAQESYNENKQRYDFSCHHGPSECYGNTIQACAMSLYPKKVDYMNFINCMESYPRPSMNGDKCARRLGLDYAKIDKCAKGEEGNRLLHEMAQLTENLDPPLYFVPWVVVDKVFTETNQRVSQRYLREVVCAAYKGTHTACRY